MPLLHILVLAAVQGITEFLPISSSAHLILVPAMTGWPDQGLTIDVAVHVGTLGAVVIYLWRDVWEMLRGLGLLFSKQQVTPGLRMFGNLVMATIPVVAAGWLMARHFGGPPRGIAIIAWASIGFGILLFAVDRLFMTVRRLEHMSAVNAFVIGLFQVLALIPGTSRAGITMMAARLFGYERLDAARFSMLLSIPTIIAAGAWKGWELYESGDARLGYDAVLSAGLSLVFALVAIAAMMAWLKRASFTPFVIYRVLLGLFLLAWIYGLLDFLPF